MSNETRLKGLNILIQRDTVVSIGDDIRLAAHSDGAGTVRVVIDAPKDMKITRSNYGMGWNGKGGKGNGQPPTS